MTSPSLQTLPVGSVVFSVLAVDKDTGSAGVVKYYIEKVSVAVPRGGLRERVCPDCGHQGAAHPQPIHRVPAPL